MAAGDSNSSLLNVRNYAFAPFASNFAAFNSYTRAYELFETNGNFITIDPDFSSGPVDVFVNVLGAPFNAGGTKITLFPGESFIGPYDRFTLSTSCEAAAGRIYYGFSKLALDKTRPTRYTHATQTTLESNSSFGMPKDVVVIDFEQLVTGNTVSALNCLSTNFKQSNGVNVIPPGARALVYKNFKLSVAMTTALAAAPGNIIPPPSRIQFAGFGGGSFGTQANGVGELSLNQISSAAYVVGANTVTTHYAHYLLGSPMCTVLQPGLGSGGSTNGFPQLNSPTVSAFQFFVITGYYSFQCVYLY